MDGAYFVGRNELLAWLRDLLGVSYDKIEQCASGAVYCQIMDSIYPVRLVPPRSKLAPHFIFVGNH